MDDWEAGGQKDNRRRDRKIDFVSRASKTFVKQTFQTIRIKMTPFGSKNCLQNKVNVCVKTKF